MKQILNSEYWFTKSIKINPVDSISIGLTVYINYGNKTYDIVQTNQEGIMIKHNNSNTLYNKAYMELAIEALDFIENELYLNNTNG